MFSIDSTEIGTKNLPYIIAELSANHGGSLDSAKLAIVKAKQSGASAVKIQSYTPDTLTINSNRSDFQITEGLWKGYSLYELYKKAYTPFEWHDELFSFARQQNITIFSTPFDKTSIDLLQKLNVPAFKIASFELIDLPLIKNVAECKKPILMSTGMATIDEISDALNTALKYGSGEILLFHCISSYPASITDCNLKNIQFLRKEFNVEVGLSDHTISNLASTISIGLGASAIEKHFKPEEDIVGVDSSFSISPSQFKSLVNDCNDAWRAIGKDGFNRPLSEEKSLKHRRSIYFIKDMKKGDKISIDNIKSIRPGYGLPPKYFEKILGKTVKQNVERGDPVSFEIINTNEIIKN